MDCGVFLTQVLDNDKSYTHNFPAIFTHSLPSNMFAEPSLLSSGTCMFSTIQLTTTSVNCTPLPRIAGTHGDYEEDHPGRTS